MKRSTRRIVCATDFSTNARKAAEVAAALAQRIDAQLVLVHVADEYNALPEGSAEFRAMAKRFRVLLRKEALRLRRSGASVVEVLRHGNGPRTRSWRCCRKIRRRSWSSRP
jgi:nucleotide-binding universal stress UspA family protein